MAAAILAHTSRLWNMVVYILLTLSSLCRHMR